ncbi:MAG: cobalamin-dependent protein [Methanoregulaceae archaeon]|jgi:5-methyltetrahydrofolate--homocysteine methyltransferase|nr:cobalamin-dependent protein [Methanoregulaceae archaeon]
MADDSIQEDRLSYLVSVLLDFKGTRIREFCQSKLDSGADPFTVFGELQAGLEEIGKGYEDPRFRRYFNSDLIVSGRNMKRAIELLKPLLPPRKDGKGHVVIGTVAGDVHDIGKTIFAVTLESDGFIVTDIGVDVPCARFVEAVRKNAPDILAMSSLLTTTLPEMRNVIKGLSDAGFRNKVRIIVGGHAVTEGFAQSIGADAYGRDCVEGLRKCRMLMQERK